MEADWAGLLAQRARAGERTCWRIEEEQDLIVNAAWADWNQGQEVRTDDILLQQTNVAAAQTADRTAAPMMCIGREERDSLTRYFIKEERDSLTREERDSLTRYFK